MAELSRKIILNALLTFPDILKDLRSSGKKNPSPESVLSTMRSYLNEQYWQRTPQKQASIESALARIRSALYKKQKNIDYASHKELKNGL